MVPQPPDLDFLSAFNDAYRREFGFVLERRAVLVDDIRVRATGQSAPLPVPSEEPLPHLPLPPPARLSSAYFEETGRGDVPVYILADLVGGHEVPGPALIIDKVTTVVVIPRARALVTSEGSLVVSLERDVQAPMPNPASVLPPPVAQDMEEVLGRASPEPELLGNGPLSLQSDPILLAVFSHRFMSIAEQMGRTLQRTAVSVNIKERLDFSCALFGPDGSLVANAPHMPVHLGSMGAAVRSQLAYYTHGPGAHEGLNEVSQRR